MTLQSDPPRGKHHRLNEDRAELLALTDHALVEAQRYKALWLATGDLTAYRLWQAMKRDREMLLSEVDHDRKTDLIRIDP